MKHGTQFIELPTAKDLNQRYYVNNVLVNASSTGCEYETDYLVFQEEALSLTVDFNFMKNEERIPK